jgi:hypothetical protein
MAIIYPHFLQSILDIHDNIHNNISYPFFDSACICYEALRSVYVESKDMQTAIKDYGLTEYAWRKSLSAFRQYGVAGLIGLESKRIIEDLSVEAERMVFVLKKARPWLPATKMVTLIKGFNHDVSVSLMRHLYASYGWAMGTRPYKNVDFWSLNLKVLKLSKLRIQPLSGTFFFHENDRLQMLIEVFRTIGTRGITNRYPGSRVSFEQHKKNFLSLGLLGLVDRDRAPFRNSKLGFADEGRIILSKIQKPEKNEIWYLKILESKKIRVAPTCVTNIFTRWGVDKFQSHFVGDLKRFLTSEDDNSYDLPITPETLPHAAPIRMDKGFIFFIKDLTDRPIPLANPGIFLFLHYLNRLKIFEKASCLMDLDPQQGYSWFSLLILNLGRIFGGISSISKACRTHELSLPLMAGLVAMPCNDTILKGLSSVEDSVLLQLRQYLTQAAKQHQLIEGKRIAFDFKMRDFTGDDHKLKNIGKGPSPKRKICFPGFRPHVAWDIDTGAPISIEFRNGKARGTTALKRYIMDLITQSIGNQSVEHVYLDSEYTAEHIWKFIIDPQQGLGADLTMCIKQNKRVKQFIKDFLKTNPTWIFFDEDHTFSEQTFEIPIRTTDQILQCVLKRKEKTGQLRCFGSTLKGLDSRGVLEEYRSRWTIENGIKDLSENYYFDKNPGTDPHQIDVHYFIVTLARICYEMFSQDYQQARNADASKKTIGTIRPEFIIGSNAAFSRKKNELILRWIDHYSENQYQALENLFEKLNEQSQPGLPFLGGLKLRFELAQPRSKKLRNQFKRELVEF